MSRSQFHHIVLNDNGTPVTGAHITLTSVTLGTDVQGFAARTGSTTVADPMVTTVGKVDAWFPRDVYTVNVDGSGVGLTSYSFGWDANPSDTPLDQLAKPTGAVDLNGQRLTNAGAASSGGDLMTRTAADARYVATGGSVLSAGKQSAHTVLIVGESIALINGTDYPISGPSTEVQRFGAGNAALCNIGPDGYVSWARALSGGRLRLVKNAGYAGATSTTILAAIQDNTSPYYSLGITPAPDIVICNVDGGDDPGTVTATTAVSNIQAICALLKAAYPQAKRYWTTLIGANIPSGGNATFRQVVNPAMRTYCRLNDWDVLDFEKVYTDPTTGLPPTGWSQDAVHPNPVGGLHMGRELLSTVGSFLSADQSLVNDYTGDSRVAIAQGAWSTDALMRNTGTGGNSGSGPGDPNVATNWLVQGPTGFTYYLQPRDDQYGNWQVVRLPAGLGSAQPIAVYRGIGAFPAGAQIHLEFEMMSEGDWTGVTSISLAMSTNLSNVNATVFDPAGNPGIGPYPDPGPGVRLTLKSYPITIPSGGTSSGFAVASITAVTGTIRVGRFSLVRDA